MSLDLGGGAVSQNVLHVCKISFILLHLALVIILINLTASVKIIYDALKMIGSNCFSGRTRDLNFRGRFVKM